MSCDINRNSKRYVNIEKFFGLATYPLLRKYFNEKNLSGLDENNYPTLIQLKNWFRENKDQTRLRVSEVLSEQASLTPEAMIKLLHGVVHNHFGKLYINKSLNEGKSDYRTEAGDKLFFNENLKIMEQLALDYPTMINLDYEDISRRVVTVNLNTVLPTIQEFKAVKDRAKLIKRYKTFDFSKQGMSVSMSKTLAASRMLALKFKNAFGVDFEEIDTITAEELLRNSERPYNGQPAFVYADKVYLVADRIFPNTVIHEYAHVFLKGIRIQNPSLFDSLYSDLMSTAAYISLKEKVKRTNPDLSEDSIDFKEEMMAEALESKAMSLTATGTQRNDPKFDKFIEKLIYAVKKVIRQMVKRVNLNKLSPSTTLDELANMMVNEDFVIEDMPSFENMAPLFKSDYDNLVDELKNTDAKNLLDAINRTYNESVYQLKTLYNSPLRLKQELAGKNGEAILRTLRDYLSKYQTTNTDPTKVDVEDVLQALEEQQLDFRIRGIAFVESINEIEVFTKRIQKILSDMKKDGKHLTNAGNAKLQYYKQFLSRQQDFIKDMNSILTLDESNKITSKLLGIKFVVENSLEKAKAMEFEYVNEFIVDNSKLMNENIEKRFSEEATKILSKEGFSKDDIKSFIEEVVTNPDSKSFDLNKSSLGKMPNASTFLLKSIKDYYAKRIVKDDINKYLKGEVEDMGAMEAMLNPYSNIDDPFGSFVRHTKASISNAETKSLKQSNELMSELLPHLEANGYNPNNTAQLEDLTMFIDTVGTVNNKGEFEKFEVHTVLNNFKNWRADKAELEYNLDKARSDQDKDAIKTATKKLLEFHENYMHRKYKNEVYDVQKMWTKANTVKNPETQEDMEVSEDLSMEAYLERQKAMDVMNMFSTSTFTEMDDIYESTESAEARTAYESLFNVYDTEGNYKKGDELKKTLLRIKYRNESRKFYEYFTNIERVQKDLDHFVHAQLGALNITMENNPEEFENKLKAFEKKNFRIAYTQEYYDSVGKVIDEIQKITESSKGLESAQELAELYKQRFTLTKLVRDKDNQPDGTKLSPNQIELLKTIEDKIVSLQDSYDNKTGLQKEELNRYNSYQMRFSKGEQLNDIETEDLALLDAKIKKFGIDPVAYKLLNGLFSELAGLRNSRPTDYYMNVMNELLKDTKQKDVTLDNADEWINSAEALQAKAESARFSEWFEKNHYIKQKWDPVEGRKVDTWVRLKTWTVAEPKDPSHYETTELIHPITNEAIIIKGVPSPKYSYQKIKKQYLTGYDAATDKVNLEVGVQIDNKGNYLPRLNATDTKYINEKYTTLKKQNNAQYKLIEAYTKAFLSVQEGKPRASKLYLDQPRFRRRSNLEYAQSGALNKDVKEKSSAIMSDIKSQFKRSADQAESGFNFNTDALLVTTDIQGEPIQKVPVRGLYRLNANETSKDYIPMMLEYMYSLNRQQELTENEATALAIRDVFTDPENAIKNIDKISKDQMKVFGNIKYLAKGDNRRAQAVKHFIDNTYYGKGTSSFQEENPAITKVAKGLMGQASRAFAGLDIGSAMKNKYGMLFQTMVEATAGEYINNKSLAQGRLWSYQATVELTTKGIYTKGPKSLNMQLMENFDPITGKTSNDFGKSTSRTFMKDFFDGTWMFDSRRLMEAQEGLSLFGAMMNHKMIDQVQADGSVKKIKYIDAFELNADKQMVLKKGINPEYGPEKIEYVIKDGDTLESIAKEYNITVEELKAKNKLKTDSIEEGETLSISEAKLFNDFKMTIQGVGQKLNGMINQTDSPQANKYLAFNLFSFYRKFAVPMFLNRFQADMSKNNKWGEVYDWNTMTTGRGYYIDAFFALKNIILKGNKYLPIMTKREKAALTKTVMEGMYLAILAMSVSLLFGYDPADEDRFEKLRDREDDYGALGWAGNHILYQLIMIRRENESFIPLPGIGLDEWLDFAGNSTIVTGPTLKLYGKILVDMGQILTGSDKAYYKQDIGPYSWQEKGSLKLWNHLSSIFGLKGKNTSPIWAIKKAEQFENLR